MKRLYVAVAIVLCSSLAKYESSDEDLTPVVSVYPEKTQFYKGEFVILTCIVGLYSPKEVTYSWFRHNTSTPVSSGIGRLTYVIDAMTVNDTGEYWCSAWLHGTNTTLLSEPISLSVATRHLVWVVYVTLGILLLITVVVLLLVLRRKIKFPGRAPRGVSAQQEMPKTKQDVTEIQWDLAWMEMANLLDKQQYPGR